VTSRFLRYLSVALVAVAMIATVAGGSADAKKKRGVGKSVDSSEIEDGTIVCADIAAAVFPNGCPDDDSGAVVTPPGNSGGVTKFDANLTSNQTKSVTSGAYVLSSTAAAGGVCGPVELTNTAGLFVALIDNAVTQALDTVAAVGSAAITPAGGGYAAGFTANQVLPLGAGAAGQASAFQLVPGTCQVGGYIV
jgi:hypothetical protein